MARSAVADGIDVAAATAHVREDYPTSAAEMEGAVDELRQALAAEGVALEAGPGGEIAFDRLRVLGAEELSRFGLAGNPSCLLLEFPYYGWAAEGAHPRREPGAEG